MNPLIENILADGALSHIDNVQVRLCRQPKRNGRVVSKKLNLDYNKVRAVFRIARIVEVNSDFTIPEYKFHDTEKGICYKIFGNHISISLARRVWAYDDSPVSYYKSLVDGVAFLFESGIIKSNGKNLRAKARYYLLARGKVVIEHAIDMRVASKPRLEGTSATSKRYNRIEGQMTRFEILIREAASYLRVPLKQQTNAQLTASLYELIVRKHTLAFSKRSTTLELAQIFGVPFRTDTHRAKKHLINRAVSDIVLTRELAMLTTPEQRVRFAGLDHQNVI